MSEFSGVDPTPQPPTGCRDVIPQSHPRMYNDDQWEGIGLDCGRPKGHEGDHVYDVGGKRRTWTNRLAPVAVSVPVGPQPPTEKPRIRPASYLTVPQFHRLGWACAPIRKAFGSFPYLVGSVLHRPDYRDVDLRLSMSPDNDSFGTDFWIDGTRLLVINVAISDWLRQITQLPIDFQFQPYEEFKTYDGEPRNPMGMLR